MTRRIVWTTVLGLALLALAGAWFAARFERVPVEAWSPPGKEALRNPLLALERFMAAMGRPLARADNAAFLDHLPPGGVLILDNRRRAHLSPTRLNGLLAWIHGGGYLIVVPETPGVDDPVLAAFHVNCGCGADPAAPPPDPKAKKSAPPGTIAVAIPGTARPLKVAYPGGALRPGDVAPEWRAGVPDYPNQILHLQYGSGNVTMMPGFSRLYSNQNIGRWDHAELLWTLVETYQPDRSKAITLVSHLATPTLWQWLAESAWTAVASAAVLIALWLWRVVPRFGPIRPEPEPARRELGEHLAAIGRYVWRAGDLDYWLQTARESFQARLALRHPALLALPPAEQAAALAQLTQRPVGFIAAALDGPATSPQSFTLALRTLYNLERIL